MFFFNPKINGFTKKQTLTNCYFKNQLHLSFNFIIMEYVYLAMAAIVLVLFGYKKLTASKKTDEYLPKNEKK